MEKLGCLRPQPMTLRKDCVITGKAKKYEAIYKY